MDRNDMTRKEFLGIVGAFVAFIVLRRLPLSGDASKTLTRLKPGSYGTNTYGGTTAK
jgi:uncharacterized membrane protein YeaQ/YmgE (transglycosylase-associated protein family)